MSQTPVPQTPVRQTRFFVRADRDQLTGLVNAHLATVVPGWALPAAALLAHLEAEPAEYVVDPWVVERCTLVTVEADRLVAAAHLRRYGTDSRVGAGWRGAGEVAWLVCWPQHPAAGAALAAACVRRLDAWQVTRQYADGALPTPATYGVPDSWPHVAALLRDAGFSDDRARTEVQLAGGLDGIAPPGPAPVPGLRVERTVGVHGARHSAVLADEVVGFVETVDDHSRGGALARLAGWADLAELHVAAEHRGRGIGTHLVRHLAGWLRLGGTRRFLVALGEDEADLERFCARFGWTRIGRTRRGWERSPGHGHPVDVDPLTPGAAPRRVVR